MATQYSNKPIVTDGLVYALDFGNQKSYVSGSTTAESLIYNPTTASVSSSGLDDQGFLNLGTSNYVLTNKGGFNLGYTSAYTIMYTADPKGTPNNYEAGQIIQGGNSNTQRFWTGLSSTRISHWFLPDTSVNSAGAYTGRRFPITPGKQHIAIRYSSGSYSLFRNGILISPSAGPAIGGLAAGGNLSIGAASYFGITGSFAQFQVYDRALTSDEIWNNYQLSAQRYGIGTVSAKPYTLDENAYLFLSQSGITDPIITSSIDTFVRGLKQNNLWDKMIAIYPFVGTGSEGVNLTGSQSWNLKEPTTAFYKLAYNGSWEGSTSGSAPSGSGTYINSGINPKSYHPYFLNNNAHISILSYDTPVSSSYLMGTGMTEDLAISTLAGDYGTPAAAYSVRKVRTAYSGALMDVRRSIDNVTQSIGFVDSGDLDTGSLLDWTIPGRNDLPGEYEGLAAAYSLRKVSASYDGYAVKVRGDIENQTRDIGFDASGNLDTGSLLNFTATGSNTLAGSYSGLAAAYSLRRVVPGYSGNLIEVRSGSVSQSIGMDSLGNLDTGSLLTFAGSGDAFVKTWYDQSGNGNHVSNTSSLEQPQIVSNSILITLNNKPAIDHTRSQVLKLPSDINLSTTYGLFAVVDFDVYGAEVFGSLTPPFSYGIYQDATNNYHAPSAIYASSNGVFGLDRALLSIIRDGTTSVTQYKNSSILGSTMTLGGNADFKFGTLSGESSTYNLDGKLSEILIYSSSQSITRTFIENNINAYYDIYTTSSTSTENAFVSTWYDQSGNNRHATQTATGSQPLIVSSGSLVTENGKPALSFDGVDDSLNLTQITPNTDWSMFGIGAKKSSSGIMTFLGSNNNNINSTLGHSFDGRGYLNNGTQYRQTDITYTNTDQTLWTGIVTSSIPQSIYRNSILLDTTPINASIAQGFNMIGRYNDWYTTGSLTEILLYQSNQSANRPLIENNINNYYNIYTGSNHGFVARWYDQSGNNNHATQTTAGSQPMIVESGSLIIQNAKPGLQFDGVNDNLSNSTNLSLPQPNTIIAVAQRGDLTEQRVILDTFLDINRNVLQTFDGKHGMFAGSVLAESVGTLNTNQNSYFSLFNGASSNLYVNNSLKLNGNAGSQTLGSINIGAFRGNLALWSGSIQEVTIYNSNQSSNREPIEYNINNYYNIYTQPTSSNWTTSSFTIQATPTAISGAINNKLTSGIPSSGPLGLITVSRTGSNSLSLARNGTTTSFDVPASGALSTGIYLGAINNNGLALGNSPLNLSFASVGTGLTGAETSTYFGLVNSLNYKLGRGVNTEYNNVLTTAVSLGYTLPSIDQQTLQNQLITDLKNAGIWNKLDIFYVFATNGDQNFARLNWKNPSLYRATNVTSDPIFRTNIGFTGPNRLNTNFPSTSGVNYTLNDASRHAWVYFSYGGNQRIDSAGGSNFNTMENRNGSSYQTVNSGNGGTSTGLAGIGMKSVHRLNSTDVLVINGTSQQSTTLSSTELSASPQHIFGGTVDISMYSMGASLVAENTNYIAAFQSYLTAISS